MTPGRLLVLGLIPLAFAARAATAPVPETRLSGRTMGSSWSVRLDGRAPAVLEAVVQAELDALEAVFSTWRADSELMRFNAAPEGAWREASPDLVAAAGAAWKVRGESGGAFDPAILPLLRAWGFGPYRPFRVPSDPELHSILESARQARLDADPVGRRLRRFGPALDLSGIAEGFAADRISDFLAGRGFPDSLVEVGGELRVRGRPRRIGIESPDGGPPLVLGPLAGGVSTSGTYRQRHLLDPRTGRPVDEHLVQATALHASAAIADAWATALMAAGEEGLGRAEAAGVAARLVFRVGGALRVQVNRAFERLP